MAWQLQLLVPEMMDTVLELVSIPDTILLLQQDPPEPGELPDLLGMSIPGYHNLWGDSRVQHPT